MIGPRNSDHAVVVVGRGGPRLPLTTLFAIPPQSAEAFSILAMP